ncbi:hypothetical protein OG607_01545 [Streptomyces sp. NBC_01537]|uniref:hypothetical protein n=1 Tax=Streptomyces sp. NBC_01537 TaxID=2903896 RepID=UPI0038636BF2
MPDTSVAAAKQARTGQPASAAGLTRRTPRTTAPVMPLWQGLALLFAPAKGNA